MNYLTSDVKEEERITINQLLEGCQRKISQENKMAEIKENGELNLGISVRQTLFPTNRDVLQFSCLI